jgi:hypothetical protein
VSETLTARELNRALLARQRLLERAHGGIPELLRAVGGLQAQYAPAMYVGLWTRLEGFERHALTRALEARTVAQGTLMRITIHLVAPADYWPFALAVRDARRTSWLRSHRDVTAAEFATAAQTLREPLAQGPLHRREIEALVGKELARGVGLWVDLLRVPPLGTWERRRADLYALAEAELGPPTGAEDAVAHLVRAYLRGFGPASLRDVASYTGLALTELKRVEPDLRRFAGPDGEELLDVPDGLLPDPETPAPPRFLPVWDASLLVHARRTGVLPEAHRSRVFHVRNPHGTATFLLDGAVAGAWRHEDGRIVLDPYEPLDPAARRALDDEAERLTAFYDPSRPAS